MVSGSFDISILYNRNVTSIAKSVSQLFSLVLSWQWFFFFTCDFGISIIFLIIGSGLKNLIGLNFWVSPFWNADFLVLILTLIPFFLSSLLSIRVVMLWLCAARLCCHSPSLRNHLLACAGCSGCENQIFVQCFVKSSTICLAWRDYEDWSFLDRVLFYWQGS